MLIKVDAATYSMFKNHLFKIHNAQDSNQGPQVHRSISLATEDESTVYTFYRTGSLQNYLQSLQTLPHTNTHL